MNLKKSKLLRRIQDLRKISKEKMRYQREKVLLNSQLQSALTEQIDSCDMSSGQLPEYLDKQGDVRTERPRDEDNMMDGGLIQINSKTFRMQCPGRRSSKEDVPSIRGIKGSICVSNSRYTMIGKVSKSLGYKLVKESKMWNIMWTDSLPGVELYKTMKRFQQINHFPGMMEICRKDLLSRNLNRMLKLFPRDYKIFPKTWMFPADYGEAMTYASNHCRSKPRTFIIKPDSGCQGRGIWLTNDLKTINPSERMICQTYITKPLLIDGYKFDLRVYTLITSVDPLRIFVFNEGLARFATNKYVEPSADNSTDLFMHLTNYSVNKRSSQYELCDNDDCGSKRKFSAINNWMRRRNYDVDEFWGKIDDIIIKTVLSAWPVLKHNYHACFPAHDKIQACFEILGFDVLVDSKLKPYILEVNHSPSFHTNEAVDRQVKKALIRDTLSLVSTPLADKKQIIREDRKRVKQRLLKTKPVGGEAGPSSGSSAQAAKEPKNSGLGTAKSPVELPAVASSECRLSPLSQQIAWEESHLGEFRRIMPPQDPAKLNYYCQFYALQNQASIYGDTAASKKREEVARKMRHQLEEKRQKQLDLQKYGNRMKFEERRRKRAQQPRALVERNRMRLLKSQVHWTPGFVSEAEERLRRSWLQMRTDTLKNMKIVELIYKDFYDMGILTNGDIVTYPELFQSLENGVDIMTLTDAC